MSCSPGSVLSTVLPVVRCVKFFNSAVTGINRPLQMLVTRSAMRSGWQPISGVCTVDRFDSNDRYHIPGCTGPTWSSSAVASALAQPGRRMPNCTVQHAGCDLCHAGDIDRWTGVGRPARILAPFWACNQRSFRSLATSSMDASAVSRAP
jgi:hypothetical protein